MVTAPQGDIGARSWAWRLFLTSFLMTMG